MNLLSLSHGQIHSKIWLCEELEPLLPQTCNIIILGAWYNILGFMLLTRNPNRYDSILGIDIDPKVKIFADKVCDAWIVGEYKKINNITADANTFDLKNHNIVINCSVEHMESNQWFHNIEKNSLVCLQSSNIDVREDPWLITNPNPTLEILKEKYPLSEILFMGEKPIQYDDWGYKRFMIIGIK